MLMIVSLFFTLQFLRFALKVIIDVAEEEEKDNEP
jgi:hypothetical protein